MYFFFTNEVNLSEWCCSLERLSCLFGCIDSTTDKNLKKINRCDCRSGNNNIIGNNKYKNWPGSQFKKFVFLLFPLKSNTYNVYVFHQWRWRVYTYRYSLFLYMAFPLIITLFIIHITCTPCKRLFIRNFLH